MQWPLREYLKRKLVDYFRMKYDSPSGEKITLQQIQRLEDEIAQKDKEIKLIKGRLTNESNSHVNLLYH